MKRSISIFMFVVIALISACNVSDPNIDNGDATARQVDLKINVPGIELKTRAIGLDQENEIKSIYLLAFKVDGDDETFDYAAIGTKTGSENNGASQTFSVKVQIKEYPQRFVVITNANTEVAAIVDAATVGDDKAIMLAALKFSKNGAWNASSASEYTAFPMWGESTAQTITDGTSAINGSIQMLRMIAKINVQLDTENNNTSVTDVFKLKSVRLYNTNDMGHIVPAPGTISNGVATSPTVPSTATLTRGPIAYSDFSSPGLEDIAIRGAIYLFETAAVAVDNRNNATCIVIGGHYGTETEESYYRIDFTENDGSFSNILRNHQYIVNVTRVSGKGYATPEEAFNAKSVNIEADVIYWNENGLVNINTDGQYILSVSEDEFTFDGSAVIAGTGGNILDVFTDYMTTATGAASGWYLEKIVDAADGTTSVNWLSLSSTEGVANTKATITLTAPKNDTSADRSAIIWISAGRLRVAVTVKQELYTIAKRFARSNIVWVENPSMYGGGYLTFAVTPDDNTAIPANSQGLFFMWGSLLAISPAALSGTDNTYTAGIYPTGHIIYDPRPAVTPAYDYTWRTIPYANENSTPFDNSITTEDDFANYNNDIGFNIATGKGDICRYISAQKWVSGNWRLPTADEYDQLIDEQRVTNGPYTDINITPDGGVNTSGKGLNAFGFYQYPSGAWLGFGSTISSGEANPTNGVYFPASGDRNSVNAGSAIHAGYIGYAWTGSSNSVSQGYYLSVGSGFVSRQNTTKDVVFPVRCIKE